MNRRFSEQSQAELYSNIEEWKRLQQKAKEFGHQSEVEIFEQKIQVALSYMVDPANFKTGLEYDVKGNAESVFQLEYINGVFAWGILRHRQTNQKTKKALPLALLIEQ
ncbi:MAG TPA: DUF1811 family protein [Candidatus Avamphibacillus intestinigallinarum]|nr:DUF1811 family protein [Candidatus Avamphibacillus intestinigallinarum]